MRFSNQNPKNPSFPLKILSNWREILLLSERKALKVLPFLQIPNKQIKETLDSFEFLPIEEESQKSFLSPQPPFPQKKALKIYPFLQIPNEKRKTPKALHFLQIPSNRATKALEFLSLEEKIKQKPKTPVFSATIFPIGAKSTLEAIA